MKKTVVVAFLALVFCSLSAFEIHKFYMAIFQVNYAPEKKIEKKYGKKTNLGLEKETVEDLNLLKKYFNDNLIIKVNGQTKPVAFLSKDVEGDVLICYCRVTEVAKLQTAEINNTLLTHWNSEQQNILHFNAFGEKKSFLFTTSNKTEVLKF